MAVETVWKNAVFGELRGNIGNSFKHGVSFVVKRRLFHGVQNFAAAVQKDDIWISAHKLDYNAVI